MIPMCGFKVCLWWCYTVGWAAQGQQF